MSSDGKGAPRILARRHLLTRLLPKGGLMAGGLMAGAVLGLGGCGFHPLYGEGGRLNQPGVDPALLASIQVGRLPDRSGQLLRRALMDRLEGDNPGVAAKYELTVAISGNVEPMGYRPDGTITRVRSTWTGNWQLTTLSVPPSVVDLGVTSVMDAYNIPDNQFYAADISREAMDRRLVQQMADSIVNRIAIGFRQRDEAARR